MTGANPPASDLIDMEISVVIDAIDITPNRVKIIPYIKAFVLMPSVPINIKLLIIDEDKNNTVHKKQNIITAISAILL